MSDVKSLDQAIDKLGLDRDRDMYFHNSRQTLDHESTVVRKKFVLNCIGNFPGNLKI